MTVPILTVVSVDATIITTIEVSTFLNGLVHYCFGGFRTNANRMHLSFWTSGDGPALAEKRDKRRVPTRLHHPALAISIRDHALRIASVNTTERQCGAAQIVQVYWSVQSSIMAFAEYFSRLPF